MLWNKDTKEKISYTFAVVAFVVGVGLMIAGFVVPPLGEIAATVLTATGEMLAFAGSILGISYHYQNELDGFKARVRNYIEDERKHINYNGTDSDDSESRDIVSS